MKLKKYFKYAVKIFVPPKCFNFFLQLIILIIIFPQGALKNNYRIQIDANLLRIKNRFFGFISKNRDNFVKIDIVLAIFIFLFLIFLFSTKFYTYVNELSFSLDTNYFGGVFLIFLIWTSSVMVFTTMLRFANLISRVSIYLYIFWYQFFYFFLEIVK